MPALDPRSTVTLVAMPPSGETFLARDSEGVLWLIRPPGAGGPQRADEEVVEIATARHGFERIEQDFAGWEALDAERQRRAGLRAPAEIDVEAFDATDVDRVLAIADRWRREGDVERPRRVAHRLLEAPIVREDDGLFKRLTSFLRELDEVRGTTPPAVVDEQRAAARRRLRLAS